MQILIQSDAVNVFHDPATGTGGCIVSFVLQETDAANNVTQVGPFNYNQDDIGLTAQNKTTLDNLITAIKNAAVAKFKADMSNITLAPGA